MGPVSVVGLGAMGSRIARRLLGAGYAVTVWNRSPGNVALLAGLGHPRRPARARVPGDSNRIQDLVPPGR